MIYADANGCEEIQPNGIHPMKRDRSWYAEGYVSFLCARKSFIPICESFLRSAAEAALLEDGEFTTSCRISTASFIPLPGLRNSVDNSILMSACWRNGARPSRRANLRIAALRTALSALDRKSVV